MKLRRLLLRLVIFFWQIRLSGRNSRREKEAIEENLKVLVQQICMGVVAVAAALQHDGISLKRSIM
jgi:hypothetical protein